MSYCTNCGHYAGEQKFCTKCGNKIVGDQGTDATHINRVIKRQKRPFNIGKIMLIIIGCIVIGAGVVCASSFFGNIGNPSNDLLGRWEKVNDVSGCFDELEFFSDNTYDSDDSNYFGDYSIDGDRIRLEGVLVSPMNCTFTVKKDSLIIVREDKIWEFERVAGTVKPSGNNKKTIKQLQGQWELTSDIHAPFDELEFFSDGKYSSDDSNYNGRYSVDGDRIKFEGILVSPVVCSFELKGEKLILKYDDDDTWEFQKN